MAPGTGLFCLVQQDLHSREGPTAPLRPQTRPPINIDWDELIRMQVTCLRNGINKVGIADLVIAQHAIHSGLQLMSFDKHFGRMARHLPLTLLPM